MAFSVNTLPEYVQENREQLLTAAALGADTLGVIETYLNVKHKQNLNYLAVTAPFQDASTCGFNANGTDTISQRVLEVKPLKVNKEYCVKDLLPKYLNTELKIAAGMEQIPFEQKFMDENNKAINRGLEKLIWQGDSSLGIVGFVGVLTDPSTGAIDSSVAAGSGADDLIADAYAHIPVAVLENTGAYIFVSHTTFKNYIADLNAVCCANRPIIDANQSEMKYIGDSRVTIKPVAGLEGTTYAIAGDPKNFVFGTDVEDSQNVYKLWFSEDDDVFKYKVEFNAGMQIAFPGEVVITKIAA